MTLMILIFQIAIPMMLIGWLAFLPAASLVGLMLQAMGTGAFLFALARVAQWAVPVWWFPWLYGGLWLVSFVISLSRVRSPLLLPLFPDKPLEWALFALSIVLLGVGSWYGARALAGRHLPPVDIVDIANPFGPGRFLVGHGGSNKLVNGHLRTLDPEVERFRPWRGQSYAVDFFGLGPWGLRAAGWRPRDPNAYAVFGAELKAPCNGTIVRAEDTLPDFEIPDQDTVNRLGNHVILRCSEAEIVFAHMRQDSLSVAPGDDVVVGQRLGAVGNSGASTEPHLHIHAQRPAPEAAPPISGEPLALRIDGRFLVRGDRLNGATN